MTEVGENNIKAYVRLKPTKSQQQQIFVQESKNLLFCRANNQNFQFNEVFDEKASNSSIFNTTYAQMIEHNFKGFNSCILAYGQTSSGKTHTMKGTYQDPGIIPLCIQSIFQKITRDQLTAQLRISYFQIYNENVYDLLGKQANVALELREQKGVLTIKDLTSKKVTNISQSMRWFQYGQLKRRTASNNINQQSSRSHVIFRITLSIVYQKQDQVKSIHSQINMVDLAGSQGVSRTKAEGTLKKQGQNINKSILALSNVMRSMSTKQQYINFRDSKLTRILQKSLCINSKSMIICTINTNEGNLQQSFNTLKFGQSASRVQILTKQNMKIKPTQGKLRQQTYSQIFSNSSILEDKLKEELQSIKQELIKLKNQLLNKNKQCEELRDNLQECQNEKKDLQSKNVQNQLKLDSYLNQSQDKFEKFNEEMSIAISQRNQYHNKYLLYKQKYHQQIEEVKRYKKNQVALIQKKDDYQVYIQSLKEAIQKNQTNNTDKINQKSKYQKRKNRFYSDPYKISEKAIEPITLNTIVELKSRIITTNMHLAKYVQQNSYLTITNTQLTTQNADLKQKLQYYSDQHQNFSTHSKSKKIFKVSLTDDKQLKYKRKIKQLTNQISLVRQRQKKALIKLRQISQNNYNIFDQFYQWKQRRQNPELFCNTEVQTQQLEPEKYIFSQKKQFKQFQLCERKQNIQFEYEERKVNPQHHIFNKSLKYSAKKIQRRDQSQKKAQQYSINQIQLNTY